MPKTLSYNEIENYIHQIETSTRNIIMQTKMIEQCNKEMEDEFPHFFSHTTDEMKISDSHDHEASFKTEKGLLISNENCKSIAEVMYSTKEAKRKLILTK